MSQKGWVEDEGSVNWDDVSTEAPPPLDDGIYRGRIISAEAEKTTTGKPGAKVQVQVSQTYAGGEIKPARKLTTTVVFVKDAAFRVKQLAAAAGVAPPSSFGYEPVSTFCDELVGCDVILRTKQEEYKGRMGHKLDRFLDAAQASEQAATGSAASDDESPVRQRRTQRAAA